MSTLVAEHNNREVRATKRELIIQGVKIVAYESGWGKPVLLLHGSPDTHEMWQPLMPYLANDIRAIAIDLPGFGQSTLPADFSLTLNNMADFLRDLLTALQINEAVTLVTTDFGSQYGLAFVVKYPTLVRGIAISNTNFFHDYKWHISAQMYRIPVIGELLIAGASRKLLRQTLKGIAPALPDDYIDRSYDSGFGSPIVRKTILRMYRERDSKDFIEWEDRLLTVLEDKPALVLWGDRDPFVSPSYADRFGKAKVHHFKDYSHWLPLEAPAKYANVLVPWLKAL